MAHINGKKESIFGSDRFPILAMLLGKYMYQHTLYDMILYSGGADEKMTIFEWLFFITMVTSCRHDFIEKESNIPHPLKHEFEHNCNFN